MAANNRRATAWLAAAALLTAGLAQPARAQQPAQLLSQVQQQFPGQPVVFLDYRQDVTLEVRGDSLVVQARHHRDLLHAAEGTGGYASDRVFSSHFSKLAKIEAKTLVPNGTSYRTQKVQQFQDQFEVRPGIFFDDVRATRFTFPNVGPGARTVSDYTLKFRDARFLQPFYFASGVPVRHAELTVTAPRAVRLSYKLFGTEQTNVQFSKEEKGSTVVYRWVADNLPAPPTDSEAPEDAWYLPHVVYFVEEAPVAGKPQKMLSGVPELYTLYRSFVKDLDQPTPAPVLKHLVDSLTAKASTPDEKARNIYHWVQDHVRYIAFEQGMRGFVPHAPALVYTRRYGDCKDMASLTHGMLQLAGLNSHLAWIGTRDLPYRYSELATPGVDNHMIAVYERAGGELVFLDATDPYNPFGLPTSMIQGKEALIGLDKEHSRVATVPVVAREQNARTDATKLTLDGNGLRGSGKLALAGYARSRATAALRGADKLTQERTVRSVLERGSNKFFVDNYTVGGLAESEAPLTVDYQFHLEDYVQRAGDELYVNLNLERELTNDQIDVARRRLPRANDYCRRSRQQTEFEIPAGYDLSHLPANVQADDPVAGFRISYRREGNKVVQDKEVYVNYLLLEPKQFAAYNRVVDQLSEAYRDALILKRKPL
jgi:transglutaminase-like putative cysteine protease